MPPCDYEIRESLSHDDYNDLITLFKTFEEQNIPIFARDGFLLGIERHAGFLPFDIDPDVGILSEDFTCLRKLKLPPKFMFVYLPNPKNFKYLFKYGIPYEFVIYKVCPKHRAIYLTMIILCVVVLLSKYSALTKVLGIVGGVVITILLWLKLHKPVLDGTIYHSDDGENYFEEMSSNEKEVAKNEYGNITDRYYFHKSDIKPLRKSRFYDDFAPVPKNSRKVLMDHYGNNVFEVMFKKEDNVLNKINITNCVPPPAKLVM